MGMMGGGMYRYLFNNSDDTNINRVTWTLIKRVLAYARPYTWKIVLMFAAILVSTGLGLLSPLIIRELIDNTIPEGNLARLNQLALALVMIPLVSAGFNVLQRWLNAQVGEGVIYDLRVALYDHMQKMSLRFFTNTRTGELMSRLNNDVVNAQGAISNTIVEIITNLITVVATLAVMLTIEWRLTIIGLMVLPGFIFFSNRVGKRLRALIREAMEYNADMNSRMNETLNVSGALLVKLFGRRTDENHGFQADAAQVRDIGIRRAFVGVQLFAFIGQIGAIGTAVVFWVGGYLVITSDALTIGTIVAFGQYLARLYGPLQALATAPVTFVTSVVSFERVFEVIDLPLDIEEPENAHRLETVQGEIVFENVSFDYNAVTGGLLNDVERVGQAGEHTKSGRRNAKPNPPQADADADAEPTHQARAMALSGINMHIRPGELVALVGPSGAGKTTMTYLIPRLYDPVDGRITIDGYDLRDVDLDALAGHVGMVTQETYLFHDTIMNNILYAKPDASSDQVYDAARAANIHDFIAGLPDGYDTIAGERGYRLSGGEKQRIAIARVILKNPRILVLDEATSHLDSESEALIQDALSRVMQDRTALVIAHRLSTIRAADEILVMDRGRIVERGTHNDLLALHGLYAELHATQFGNETAPIPTD